MEIQKPNCTQNSFQYIIHKHSINRYAINFIMIKIWCGQNDNVITKVFFIIYVSQKSIPCIHLNFVFSYFTNIKIKIAISQVQTKINPKGLLRHTGIFHYAKGVLDLYLNVQSIPFLVCLFVILLQFHSGWQFKFIVVETVNRRIKHVPQIKEACIYLKNHLFFHSSNLYSLWH